MNFKLTIFSILILLSSCGRRNLVYFSDLDNTTEYKTKIHNNIEPKIQADDLLSITISSLNPESNALFNINASMPLVTSSATTSTTSKALEGYLVDKNGSVNFPVIGKIVLAGLTKEEAIIKMTDNIKEYVKNPIVNIRFLNFKVTVIGEVSRPSTFTISTEKINIIEALGLAGDMTPYGKRENVLIIREKEGIRSAIRINLNNKDVLSSPYFYLQQNDIVYVEPDKAKALQASARNSYLPLFVSISSVIVLILYRVGR